MRRLHKIVIRAVVALGLFGPGLARAHDNWCRCPGGRVFQPGFVNYKENSDRELITKIELDATDPDHRCEAAWIGFSEVYAEGTPYSFHLKRRRLKTIREDACGESPNSFVSRTKTYHFTFNDESEPIREVDSADESSVPPPALRADQKSNANVWESIAPARPDEQARGRTSITRAASAPEFVRTAWVLARRDIKAQYVALVRGVDQRESIVPLGKARAIQGGEAGQIEASNGSTAIVRFYAGSKSEKFARRKNAFRRWYDNVGGPYIETKDDLYTPLRAYIVQVRLDDIIEVNDYLDQQNADHT